jgi:carboxypeptidase C (cathepsin A)
MKKAFFILFLVLSALAIISPAAAQKAPQAPESALMDDALVITQHQIMVKGKALKYTARAGYLPIRDQYGETKGRLFYTAYTVDGPESKAKRPVTFVWNGGPGSPSSMLHFELLGPRRRLPKNDPTAAAVPYPVVDNEETLLALSDLVMVDPIGTGYSYAPKPEDAKLFYSITKDRDSIVEFIRIYLTHYDALEAPIFLIGESYGTTRAAAVAEKLVDKEYSLAGIVMVSSDLSLAEGGDLSYPLLIPSFTATAFYHKKLAPDLQSDLKGALRQASDWAETEYAAALMKGDRLGDAERKAVAANLARFTGLDPSVIEKANLRVSAEEFSLKLLSSEKKTVGKYDSRITAGGGEGPYEVTKDPSLFARGGKPFLFTQYMRSELGVRTDRLYRGPFGGIWPPPATPRGDWMAYNWEWGSILDDTLDQSKSLASALKTKDDLRVLFISGLYDLTTVYFATDYTISHLGLDPKLRANIEHKQYGGGHMMYSDDDVRVKLMLDIFAFYQGCLAPKEKDPAAR